MSDIGFFTTRNTPSPDFKQIDFFCVGCKQKIGAAIVDRKPNYPGEALCVAREVGIQVEKYGPLCSDCSALIESILAIEDKG